MSSFARYVIGRRGEDSKYGDVARDVAVDPQVSARMGYRALRECIARQQPEPVVLAILDEMYAAFRASERAARGAPEK